AQDRGRRRRHDRPDPARRRARGPHPHAFGHRAAPGQHERAGGRRRQRAPGSGTDPVLRDELMETAASNVAPFPASRMKPRAGLVLTGGGARAAYQVGVLKAVRDLLGNPQRNPFPILCGTSAGAINVACLATDAEDFSASVARLVAFWEQMRCEHIYRTDALSIMKNGARWLAAMMLISRHNPISLLDNTPLRHLL